MDYHKYQQDTFDEIIFMKNRMQMLAGFVQNDFERMIQDGMAKKKEEIKKSVIDVDLEFKKAILELDCLKNKVIDIINYYS